MGHRFEQLAKALDFHQSAHENNQFGVLADAQVSPRCLPVR
jgi:hypothetical protein